MCRLFILTISMLCSTPLLAKSSYQIDLILFAHAQNADKVNAAPLNTPLMPVSAHAIPLKTSSNQKLLSPYHLLTASQSQLSNEYYLLTRKSPYQVIGHYSWRQPSSNQSAVALPKASVKGWLTQGTLRVQEGAYYRFDTDIQFSPPSNPESSFTVSQKQRLKADIVYFLDHPQIGMLVKIHKVT